MVARHRYTRLRNIMLALALCFALLPILATGMTMPPVFLLPVCAVLFCGAWWGICRGISALAQADREKAAYEASLLQSSKLASIGKLAAGVAHEINNPLMLIREHAGWIRDLLEEEKRENIANYDDIQQAAIKVEQNVDRARDITHRLLGFARRTEAGTEAQPLHPMVEQAIGFLQTEAGYRGISIESEFSPRDPRVTTDSGQLQQVILNILDNALDALGQGGKVEVGTHIQDGMAVISIRDNGPGIPQERIQQIFDPFFTTKKPGEGTGLGLSICASIMEGLGGSIRVENLPSGGALFSVTLPCSE